MSSGGREVPTALRNSDHHNKNMLLCQTVDLERDFDNIYEELLEDLALLGDIRVQDNQDDTNEDSYDLLLFPDFCRINKLIKKYTHPTMVPSLNLLT